jgi:ATP adenylyltransferase
VTGGTVGDGCVFCRAATGDDPLVVKRGVAAFVILNLFPYNRGHVMVVPTRHFASLGDATPDELAEIITLVRDAERVLTTAYAPHGINVGLNLGRAAGAGVADHLHVHLVPRWNGDTNFMTIVADARVLPETLEQSAARLKPLFAAVDGASLDGSGVDGAPARA